MISSSGILGSRSQRIQFPYRKTGVFATAALTYDLKVVGLSHKDSVKIRRLQEEPMTIRLSKSRIMSSLQCLKRVHLEVNRRDLAHFSKATEAAFELGHQVGDIAIELYGGTHGDNAGVLIEYRGGSFAMALARTTPPTSGETTIRSLPLCFQTSPNKIGEP